MSNGKVIHCSTTETYFEALKDAADRLVVVDCYADWCPPCRAMSPVFDRLAAQYEHVVFIKVDTDKVPSVKDLLGVWALPTFAFLRKSQKISSVTGANERALLRGIENNGDVGYCSSCRIL